LDQNALHRFGHVEPGAANRCKHRQNAMLKQPEQHLSRIVSTQIIPDHQHPQWRQIFRQSDRHGQPFLPGEPHGAVRFGRQDRFFRQRSQDFSQLFLQPRMQNDVGAAGHALHADLTTRWMEEGQNLGDPIAHIFVRLQGWMTFWFPTLAWVRNGLVRPGFVLIPERQTGLLGGLIGQFDYVFFATVSGSVTMTLPRFLFRTAVPVSHQLRDCCQL